jgi:hypothetical protein
MICRCAEISFVGLLRQQPFQEMSPEDKHGVADQFLAQISDYYAGKISFSTRLNFLHDYLPQAGD